MLRKRCTKCLETKAVTEFYPSEHHRYGVHSWCKVCYRATKRAKYAADPEAARAYRREQYKRVMDDPYLARRRRRLDAVRHEQYRGKVDPEIRRRRQREASARYRARLKADPERWAKMLEAKRLYAALSRRRAGVVEVPQRRGAPVPVRQTLLPGGPFLDWLAARNVRPGAPGWFGRARDLGLVPRRVAELFNGQESVDLETVDRALMEAGDSLDALYPDLSADAA